MFYQQDARKSPRQNQTELTRFKEQAKSAKGHGSPCNHFSVLRAEGDCCALSLDLFQKYLVYARDALHLYLDRVYALRDIQWLTTWN